MLICIIVLIIKLISVESESAENLQTTKYLRHLQEDTTSATTNNALPLQIYYPPDFMELENDWRTKHPIRNEEIANQNYLTWEHYAQDGEDRWIYEHYFYGMTKGIIVESGAFDGKSHSTTHMFEKYLNWTSIHIEANPKVFELLLHHRKNSINIQAALCSEHTLLHFIQRGVIGTIDIK
jgi:hypothetical protein